MRTAAIRRRALLLLLTGCALSGASARADLPLEDGEAERFLRRAKVVGREPIGAGVTRPERLTLEAEGRTARAIWKTIDEYQPIKRFGPGEWEAGFTDSYKCEVAAYELDKMIGLGLVPPTIERRLGGELGSLQLWVADAMTESERRERGIRAADQESWNWQMLKVRLFHNLTHNTDYRNTGNVLSDAAGRIYLIDNSRAFRTQRVLLNEEDLIRFSRSLLEGLRGLRRRDLDTRLGRWIGGRQIKALLARRDLILKRAERLIADRGEDQVLYP